MFEVSTILEDDSTKLVSGGANGLVNVSLSNTATSSFGSTFVELIGGDEVSLFGEILIEGASLSMEVEEEDALVVSYGSRVVAKIESDHRALAYLRLSLGHGTSTGITVVFKICPGGITMANVSLEEEGGMVFLPS
ncbi:hypothetical protein Tco_0949322 [Tanacetum coccineum]